MKGEFANLVEGNLGDPALLQILDSAYVASLSGHYRSAIAGALEPLSDFCCCRFCWCPDEELVPQISGSRKSFGW
jgi:hypothetical protein